MASLCVTRQGGLPRVAANRTGGWQPCKSAANPLPRLGGGMPSPAAVRGTHRRGVTPPPSTYVPPVAPPLPRHAGGSPPPLTTQSRGWQRWQQPPPLTLSVGGEGAAARAPAGERHQRAIDPVDGRLRDVCRWQPAVGPTPGGGARLLLAVASWGAKLPTLRGPEAGMRETLREIITEGCCGGRGGGEVPALHGGGCARSSTPPSSKDTRAASAHGRARGAGCILAQPTSGHGTGRGRAGPPLSGL